MKSKSLRVNSNMSHFANSWLFNGCIAQRGDTWSEREANTFGVRQFASFAG